MRTSHAKHNGLRHLIAFEAARIIAENSSVNFQSARRKAASRLGCSDKRQLPDNKEIETALKERQRLFRRDIRSVEIERLLTLAVDVMRSFELFRPRLVGALNHGTADKFSPISLYLFAETAEAVALHLFERQIPFNQEQVRLRYTGRNQEWRPQFHFLAGETEVELTILPLHDRTNPPLDPVEGLPERGANIAKVMDQLGRITGTATG